ncbi:hypothetical protein FACS1894211_04470 [Clostridia bacterium]|nr:hypothetical protein FACS1894211_04470 [Clostridia bacterium]
MKKFTTILAVCLLALFCAFSFAACGTDGTDTGGNQEQQQQGANDGGGGDDGSTNGDNGDANGNNNGGDNGENENTNRQEPMITTAEAWDKVWDDAWAEFIKSDPNFCFVLETSADDADDIVREIRYDVRANKMMYIAETDIDYYSVENETFYYYRLNGDTYTRTPNAAQPNKNVVENTYNGVGFSLYFVLQNMCSLFKGHFDAFEYKDGYYLLSEENVGDIFSGDKPDSLRYEIEIREGKAIVIRGFYKMISNGPEGSTTVEVFQSYILSFGNTPEIELPATFTDA